MPLICSILLFLIGFDPGNYHEITLQVENIKIPEGKFMVAVFDHPDKFLSEDACSSIVAQVTSGGSQKLTLPVKSPGTYAICIFQDMNGNGELDRNYFGIPTEPFGFSNNPTIIWGPPDFEKTSFQFDGEGDETVIIRLK